MAVSTSLKKLMSIYQDISSKTSNLQNMNVSRHIFQDECIKIHPQKGSGQGAEQALSGSACPGRETLWRGGQKNL